MVRFAIIFCLCLMLSFIVACNGNDNGTQQELIVGGPCEYVDIPGVATIVSVENAPPEDYNCKNAVVVTFDFVPDDPGAVDNYLFPNWSDTGQHLTVGGGMNPPLQWVLLQGLSKGSKHRCERSEITDGTCTPVCFSFPDIDFSGWELFCFDT